TLERLSRALTAEDGFQCGLCTPGQLMSALALLERTPHPDRDEIIAAMSGNLCRCGAYEGIGLAVARAAGGATRWPGWSRPRRWSRVAPRSAGHWWRRTPPPSGRREQTLARAVSRR